MVWISSSPTAIQRVTYLALPEFAVPNDGIKLVIKSIMFSLHTPLGFGSHFHETLYASSVFWLSFQVNLIIINHPHRPSLSNS